MTHSNSETARLTNSLLLQIDESEKGQGGKEKKGGASGSASGSANKSGTNKSSQPQVLKKGANTTVNAGNAVQTAKQNKKTASSPPAEAQKVKNAAASIVATIADKCACCQCFHRTQTDLATAVWGEIHTHGNDADSTMRDYNPVNTGILGKPQ